MIPIFFCNFCADMIKVIFPIELIIQYNFKEFRWVYLRYFLVVHVDFIIVHKFLPLLLKSMKWVLSLLRESLFAFNQLITFSSSAFTSSIRALRSLLVSSKLVSSAHNTVNNLFIYIWEKAEDLIWTPAVHHMIQTSFENEHHWRKYELLPIV